MKVIGLPRPKKGQFIIVERGPVKGTIAILPDELTLQEKIQRHTNLAIEMGPRYGSVNYDLEVYSGPNVKRMLFRRVRVRRNRSTDLVSWEQTWPAQQLDERHLSSHRPLTDQELLVVDTLRHMQNVVEPKKERGGHPTHKVGWVRLVLEAVDKAGYIVLPRRG
jgi:hypothetical protein